MLLIWKRKKENQEEDEAVLIIILRDILTAYLDKLERCQALCKSPQQSIRNVPFRERSG
jgi:hypothetical protein